jgi:ABC-type nickel/cobalt efflux system permease component RcnA
MIKKAVLAVFLLFLLGLYCGFAQGNPFLDSGPKEKRIVQPLRYPGFFKRFILKLNDIQRDLHEKMSRLTEMTKEDNDLSVLFILIGISFIYGMIHALGPGHGKFIATSYFLSRQVSLVKGLVMGTLIAILHAGSAITLVLIIYLIIRGSYLSSLEDISRIIRVVSFASIMLIGVYLVATSIYKSRKTGSPINKNGNKINLENKNIFTVALAVGIVPCPGAVLILLFSLSMGILAIGVLLTLVMAAGMAVSISAVASLAILTRQGLTRIVPVNSKAARILQSGLRLTGSLFIFCIGLFLLLGSLNIIP